ncbi:hypothetical protein [Schinkia azotoformans]|uniref:hypothetical protein n=1 Tax=Schinkia azotoformans TaxID=1454 RepID=UPI002DB6BAB7|nr:hypothetical protein [Schinkia azotoformans]MEC1772805.1 hypothetical protein [Schinkia azotoformans]MED4367476.1 hypothetical protein [Schinkia azotoformans]
MISVHNAQIQSIIKDMVKMSMEIDKERKRINYQSPNDDNSYITYREGYYDACLDFITSLGYSVNEIEEMEKEVKLN